jgi:hypothetical protein
MKTESFVPQRKPKGSIMNKTLRFAAIAAGFAAVLATGTRAATAAEHPNIKPGKWEMTSKTEFEGMPSGMPGTGAMTTSQCYTAEQIGDKKMFTEKMQRNNKKCEYSQLDITRDKLNAVYTCADGSSGTIEGAFAGTTYEMTVHVMAAGHGDHQAVKMTQHTTAKRVGDC